MRLQLALDVSDIDEAVDFYSKLFATEPYKRKPAKKAVQTASGRNATDAPAHAHATAARNL